MSLIRRFGTTAREPLLLQLQFFIHHLQQFAECYIFNKLYELDKWIIES